MKPEYQEKTADLPQVTNNHSLIYICIHLLRIDVILNANVLRFVTSFEKRNKFPLFQLFDSFTSNYGNE
jgi:hypothetical protein